LHVELYSLAELREHARQQGDLRRVVVHGLDLHGLEELLERISCEGAVFLGCGLSPDALLHVQSSGGAVFPRLPGLPFRPYRSRLYTVAELLQGYHPGDPDSLTETTDGRIWRWYRQVVHDRAARMPVLEALTQRLHDHAMDDAMAALLDSPGQGQPLGSRRRVVAIMGGHGLLRTEPAFAEVARLGRRLARDGYLVTTGGGPGAMEAAHLGAWLRDQDDTVLRAALALLARAPSYTDPDWVDTAFQVRSRWPQGEEVESLAVPTWFYGHEPTNLFASHVAKYFSNSLREDGLLAIATSGVIYAPGSAGTVQEVFMDGAQNHYGTFRFVSPMVFLGRAFWTDTLPVLPLLRALSGRRQYADMIGLVDTADEAVTLLEAHPPVPWKEGAS